MIDETSVRHMLDTTLEYPLMWAGTREAYAARLSTLLEVLGYDGRAIYEVLPHDGPVVRDLGAPLDDEWADMFKQRASQILEGGASTKWLEKR